MSSSARVGGILLAAGQGQRFGADKREARLADGSTLLERTLGLLSAQCDETLLVIGAHDSTRSYAERFANVRVLRAERSAGGMGFSLADAMAAVAQWDACLVMLADKPFVRATSIARVREQLRTHSLVVPTCEGRWGHPVGFGAVHFAALARLEGDAGARALIETRRAQTHFVELDDPGILVDVDTPHQLRAMDRSAEA